VADDVVSLKSNRSRWSCRSNSTKWSGPKFYPWFNEIEIPKENL